MGVLSGIRLVFLQTILYTERQLPVKTNFWKILGKGRKHPIGKK
jgi:hypothetical protein